MYKRGIPALTYSMGLMASNHQWTRSVSVKDGDHYMISHLSARYRICTLFRVYQISPFMAKDQLNPSFYFKFAVMLV